MKNAWSHISAPLHVFTEWGFIKDGIDIFTFTVTLTPPPPPPQTTTTITSRIEGKHEIRQAYQIIEYLKGCEKLQPKEGNRDNIKKEYEYNEYKGVG